ncbi:MAG TPA: hypothetical protein VGS80_13595 [Ktedonobacterales bacterium]|nr:hypothetical protein [Ktedonobacterales bacterium]
MTAQQMTATERALAEHITIAAWGRIKATGAKFFLVNSSQHDSQYTVLVHQDSLECNCPAGQHGRVCRHRACVHAALVAEANAFRALDKDETALVYELHVAATKLDAALDRQR